MKIKNYFLTLIAVSTVSVSFLASCTKEPDESNLYTFTGQTIWDYVQEDPSLTAFCAILQTSGYSNNMSSYGHYTCFAPNNDGVKLYLDSLYNDEECIKMKRAPHNGIQEVAGFTDMDVMEQVKYLGDSIAKDIARYHLSNLIYRVVELDGSNVSWTTMLGRTIDVSVFASGPYTGLASLNGVSAITKPDNEVSNGVVQIINRAMPHPALRIPEVLGRQAGFTIFTRALEETGLDEVLKEEYRVDQYGNAVTYYMADGTHSDAVAHGLNSLYYPRECKKMFTLFAESDEVFAAAGINSFEDLVTYCNNQYKNAAVWYDYLNDNGISVSTGTDYTNEFNTLHMFVAYHILKAGMAVDRIVYEYSLSNENWNYAFGYEPQDYFETLLPHTLMKFWELDPKVKRDLRINRYIMNNTLTDQLACFGSDAMHTEIFPGVKVLRSGSVSSLNGYIHRIDKPLVYDQNAANALVERLRFDTSTFLTELINNGIRFATPAEVSSMNGGGNGNRVAFPLDFFDNIHCYNSGTVLRFCVQGAWRAHESDQMQGWGSYDFAVKLPPVPKTDQYEIRIFYPPMARGGLMQFYIGENTYELNKMKNIGLPFDARLNPMTEPTIGWTLSTDEDDYGVQTDKDMRIRGYMRGPASFSRGTLNTYQDKLVYEEDLEHAKNMAGGTSTRTEQGYGTMMVRHIVTTQTLKQGSSYWFRIKNLITDDLDLGWSFDFIEIVPKLQIVDNTNYTEDWY